MKALVIYDSIFGNTKEIAEVVAHEVKGIALTAGEFDKGKLKGTELLIVGSPIRGWQPLPSITAVLDSLTVGCLTGIKTAAFDTRVRMIISGDAAEKINKRLSGLGGQAAAETGKFYVRGKEGPLFQGETDKAKCWAKAILAGCG